MSARSRVSGTILVGVCVFGAACEGSGSDDDSSAGSGAQAAMPSSGGSAGTGSGGASGGTGGSAGSAGTGNTNLPDVDPNTRLVDLTDEQKAELCDWMVGLFGGYGVTTQCTVGSVQTFPSKELCVMAGLSFTCPTATVGDLEACELSLVPSGGCDRSDPSCEAVRCS